MHRPGILVAATLLVAGLLVTGVSALRTPSDGAARLTRSAEEARVRDLDLAFYRRRVERDPTGATDLAHLAALYLQRARETGDGDDLRRAEEAARRSLGNRASRNGKARAVLAAALVAEHQFEEARRMAQELVAADPTRASHRALLGEIDLELGRYDEGAELFGGLALHRTELPVAPRVARWEEVRGRPAEARRLLRLARHEARRRPAMPTEQIAWYHLRLGDLALRYGRLREAERELVAGLEVATEDHRILFALARLEAVRHRWPRAINYGERAIARAVDPATLGLLYDAYAATGDSARAEDAYRAMAVAVLRQPGPFHRAWSLFLLDHGREIGTVLGKAQEELEVRKDIYGYDLVAWARYRSEGPAEAREPMARALSLGTEDAMLWYHAGMIDLALGDTASARRHLSAALDLNPYWHPFQPAAARAVLDGMNRQL